MEEGREIVLCEWCLFDQRNGKPPGVQRGKDQWLQPYLAPVQGRLWEADRGSHESLQSPPMMMELALPLPPPSPSVYLKVQCYPEASPLQAPSRPGLQDPCPSMPTRCSANQWWDLNDGGWEAVHSTPLSGSSFPYRRPGVGVGNGGHNGSQPFQDQGFFSLSLSSIPSLALKSSVYQTNHIY